MRNSKMKDEKICGMDCLRKELKGAERLIGE